MMLGSFSLVPAASAAEMTTFDSATYAKQIEEATENLFTKVLVENAETGVFSINEAAHAKYAPEVSTLQLKNLRNYFNENTYPARLHNHSRFAKDWWKYAKCVVQEVIGVVVNGIDWKKLGKWFQQKLFWKIGQYIAREVPKHLAPALLKGVLSKLTPASFVANVAWGAVKCWGQ